MTDLTISHPNSSNGVRDEPIDVVSIVPMNNIVDPPRRRPSPSASTPYPPSPSKDPTMSPVMAQAFLDSWDPDYRPPVDTNNMVQCRQCPRQVNRIGWKPHWKSHWMEAHRVLGLSVPTTRTRKSPAPARKVAPSKITSPKATPPKTEVAPSVPHEPLSRSVPEGLAAVLSYYLGDKATVPVDRMLEVHTWLTESERFIDSLRT